MCDVIMHIPFFFQYFPLFDLKSSSVFQSGRHEWLPPFSLAEVIFAEFSLSCSKFVIKGL